MVKALPDTALRLLLSPLLAAQAVHVRSRALKLPEAAGARAGVAGAGPGLRLLILGDSSAAGVGVATQDSALTGELIARLSASFRLHWTLDAVTGATTASTLARLEGRTPVAADAVVVGLGVNDTTRFVPAHLWRARQARLLDRLRQQHGAQRIYVSGVPPLDRFPLLPNPLRWTLGRHAARLDAELCALVAARPDCTYITLDLELEPHLMAEDGFHPGPEVYRAWADTVAERIAHDFAAISDARSNSAAEA